MEFALFALSLAAMLLLSGHDPASRVTLLPDETGAVGRVVVSTPTGSRELATAYSAVAVETGGALATYQESADSIQARYGELLAARPASARSYLLYFAAGSDELAPESAATLADLRRDAERRPAPEIRVIGHTDTVGGAADNEALSARRAQAIADQLAAWGVHAVTLESTGRGENELLVPTADNVDEPRNRRVEVSIR